MTKLKRCLPLVKGATDSLDWVNNDSDFNGPPFCLCSCLETISIDSVINYFTKIFQTNVII